MRTILKKAKYIFFGAAVAVAMGAAPVPSCAATDTVTLTSKNSSVNINYDGPGGVDQWKVSGVNQLQQEWFWYRLGSTGSQASLDSLQLASTPTPVDSNGGGTKNFVSTTYQTAANATNKFKVVVTYNLTGGASGTGTSDLAESIKITDTGTTNESFHFFMYTDFNLSNTANNDNVMITGGNGSTTAGNTATQTDGLTTAESQTVVSPRPNESQIGGSNPYPNLLNELENVNGLTLNNSEESATNTNAAWGFEWDVTLRPGTSLLISVDKELRAVPEPATGVAALGMGSLLLFRRPRRKNYRTRARLAY